MQDPIIPGSTPSDPPYEPVPPPHAYPPPANGYAQAPYPPPPGGYAQPPYGAPVAANAGLSDTAAGALAYVTIIPAILFLVLAPYNTRPFVKFHSFQCLGLGVAWVVFNLVWVIPVLGWIVGTLGALVLLVVWLMCIVKASQGSYLRLPFITDFSAQQAEYPIAKV